VSAGDLSMMQGDATMTVTPAKKPYQIVVGFDFSELSERAFAEALDIARFRAPAELHVVIVAQQAGALLSLPGKSEPMTEEKGREIAQQSLSQLVQTYQTKNGSTGLDRVAMYLLARTPASEPAELIVKLASAVDADLIVVGTHGRHGVSRLLLGSVAAQVVREATTSVSVIRPPDFVRGEKVPAIEPPLAAGQPHLKQFEHRPTYHYIDRAGGFTSHTMPVT
jgi:nucleotide-binding universal stress UspA family protein